MKTDSHIPSTSLTNASKASGAIKWTGVTFIVVAFVVAWLFWGGQRTVRFQEEVKLSDGATITVSRMSKLTPFG
jgi:hypothetical protein